MSGNNDTAANNAASGAGSWFADWSARTPVVTRFTLMTIVGGSLLGFMTGLDGLTALCPKTAVLGLQIWRFFTSPLIQNGLLSLLFVVLWFSGQGGPLEMKHGSVGLLYLMCLLGLATNVIYAFGGLLLFYNPVAPMPLMMGCSGSFWPILVGLITVECLEQPDGSRRLFFLPCMIKNRIYPWIIAAFFCLLGGLAMDIIIGVVTGHLYAWGKLDRFKPSMDRLNSLENGSLAGLASQPGFIAAAVAGSDLTLPTSQPGGDGGGAGGGSGGGSGGGWVSGSGGDVFGRGRNAGGDGGGAGGAGRAGSPPTKFPGSGKAVGADTAAAPAPSAQDVADRRAAAAAAAEARVARLARGGTATSTAASSSGPKKGPPTFSVPSTISGRDADNAGALDSSRVQQLVQMGYSQDQASYALLQAGGDVDRALSLLNN